MTTKNTTAKKSKPAAKKGAQPLTAAEAKMSPADKAKAAKLLLAGLGKKAKPAQKKGGKPAVEAKAKAASKSAEANAGNTGYAKGDGRLRDKQTGKLVVSGKKAHKWATEGVGLVDCFGNRVGTRAHEFNRLLLAAHKRGETITAKAGTDVGLAACAGCINKLAGSEVYGWPKLIERHADGGYALSKLGRERLKANGGKLVKLD